MLIYDKLKRDHEKIRMVLSRLENTTARAVKTRLDLVADLKFLLKAHILAEEAVFYRMILIEDETHDQAMESLDDHKTTENSLAELEDTDPATSAWKERFQFFKRSLEHHFEEEEKDIFKRVRKMVSRDEALEMGESFEEMKSEFLANSGT